MSKKEAKKENKKTTKKQEDNANQDSGSPVVIILLLLVVIAVGAGAYLTLNKDGMDKGSANKKEMAAAQDTGETQTAAADESDAEPFKVERGNPVVAKIGAKEVSRVDVLNFITRLPQNLQQLPPEQLYGMAVQQVVNAEIIQKRASKARLDNDPQVKEQLKAAKEQIVRAVFMEKEIQKATTDERLQQAYAVYLQSFPKVNEVKARHILVKEESEAKDLIKKLGDGADFAELAKQSSTDSTAANGGELNFFAETEVVPEFGKAAFAMEIGDVSKKPVKTEFGYHVLEVQAKRQRPPAEFEQAKPFLASQLRNATTEEILAKWRAEENVEIFDINGAAIEPAAGEEQPEAAAQ